MTSFGKPQVAVCQFYVQSDAWTCKAILNVAGMGPFSSDRSIHEYAERIWKVEPVHVTLRA